MFRHKAYVMNAEFESMNVVLGRSTLSLALVNLSLATTLTSHYYQMKIIRLLNSSAFGEPRNLPQKIFMTINLDNFYDNLSLMW